ncbi:SdrD B-like domain-containing protein [Thiothrix caldifontis]|nr:SdrD B-like domain-containing protein [Thiothrix caldifontis]
MPKRRYANGSLGFSLQILFALLLLTVLTGQAFAANCTATYTQTSTGGSSNYTLTSGQSLKIASGTYTGTVEFGSGASICVETGATFTPGNLNNVAGTLTNYGTANLQTFSYNSGTVIDNYGTLSFTGGLNTNGATAFRNRANATMTMANSFQLGNNSTFINDGLLTTSQDFNTQNGTTLTNNYRMEVNGNFNPDGKFDNYGRVYATAFMNINANSDVSNYCALVSNGGFNNNSPLMDNLGTILITTATGTPTGVWQNNQPFHNGSSAKIAGKDFFNNSTFTGGGAMIFSGDTRNQGAFTGNSASDKINFYDETQTGSQFFDVQSPLPTNIERIAFARPIVLDAPSACSTSYKNFAAPLCPIPGQSVSDVPGNAATVKSSSGTITSPNLATGALTAANTTASTTTNSAKIPSTNGAHITLDLGQTIPANSSLILSLAQDTSTSKVSILFSADNTTFTSVGTYGASGTLGSSATLDKLARITVTVPAGGVRYVRFLRVASLFWVDGVAYSQVCINTPTSSDFGDAPATYGNASHSLVTGIKLGTNAPDSESASQPTHNASGDGADEDGAPKAPSNSSITRFPLLKQTDTSYSSTFAVTNTTGTAGKLYGWIDFDKNGTFEADEATSVNVPTGANNSSVTLNWSSIPADIKPGTSFIRLRLTTDTAVTTSTPTGSASNGEVEDFPIAIALNLPPNSSSVSVTKGTTPTSCTTTVFSDNFNDLTGGQYFAENRPGATPIRNWIASGGGADTRNRTDNMHNATHGTSIYMDSGAIRRIFPAISDTPSVDSNGVITAPPTALELRDIADDLTPNTTSGDSHWGPFPPSLSRTLNTTVGQRYRLYFELLPENDGNGWRNGMLRVDTPSGSVHLQTPAGTGSPYLYQVDFTANAATSTISFVNYSRLAIDDNWCDPLTTAWCTVDGLSTTPKTSEPMIDNVVVALESACVSTSTQDYGDAPASYGNPSHVITPNLMIGNHVDTESGALHSVNADGDDNNGSTDDEDGLHNPAIIPTTQGQTYTLTTYVKNETGSTAYLTAYIDFNRDGDFLDAGEKADTQHVYWNGYVQSTFTVPAGTTAGTTYARLRLSQTRAEAESPIGAATSGEVEDHKLTISSGPFYDFGDAPASYGNPRHTIVNSIFLGDNRPDAELTGQHTYNASGDGVDEDGAPKQYNNPTITLFPILKMTATSYSVDIRTTNTTGSAGKLYGWIDFDKNGTFDADEAASANVANNTNGTVTLTWNSIPTDIKLGTTFIRLRLTTDPAVTTSTPANNANNGEVEDFPIAVAIDVPPDSPDVTIVRGDDQTCSSTIFTDNFDDLASEQYFGANTSATPFVIRNWTATGGGSDTYARTVEVSPFAATQGRSIYFGNGMMRRFYPDTGGVLAFDGNGRMLSPPDAVELRDNVDDVSPGVNIHESHWGPEPVTLSRTFASTAGQRYRLYFSAIPEGGDWNSGIMRVDTPSGSVHFKAPGKDEGIQKYRIEFTATGASSTIRFVNYGHIGTDGGWCDPNSVISGPWCTVGGFPTGKKGNELIIDDVTIALASACPTSGISGTVYTDTNGNNAFDGATETGLANISVSLYDNNGTTATTSDDNLMATTSTAANGAYSFASISPTLRYRVEVDSRDADLPASAVIGTPNPLADLVVSAGSALANQNFGFDLACNASAGQFGGIAFRDYNQNGMREPQEEGIAGITVTAYNSANAVAATATTDARGWYTLSGLTNGTQYRLEYTNLPSGLYPGAAGTDTASTVRFVTVSGSCAANFGISDPIEYCQAVPPVAAFTFVNGNPNVTAVGNYASLFTFPYDATGGAYNQTPLPVTKANTSQTGALWGLAYQKTTKTLYASATMRRFSGFGALGTGGIYKVDMTYPNAAYTGTTTYVDLRTIGIDTGNDVRVTADSCNNLATGLWSPSRDVAAWDKVGKVGVGDIDYDEPNNRLWLVNLNDRKLYGISNVSPTTSPTAANVLGGYAINLPSPYTCTSGTFRPWAVKYHRGYVYVGGVCDAANDPYNLSKVRGYVLRFNPANTTAGFSHVKDFAINQPRSGYGYNASEWSGWLPQADAVNVRPQFHSPIVGNLEFDTDGSIIVGIIDRAGLQKGTNAYDEPVCDDPTIDYADTMGDVLRLCKTDTGYLSDSEPGCTTAIPANSKTTDEYYWGDLGPSNNAWESMNEIAAGGLALAPGKEHVLASSYDANSWGSNGIVWLNNVTGAKDNSYHLSWSTLGKSTGMGELEVLCDPSPVEVGNRVWLDADKDGLQGADEAGIANVNVTLTCGTDNATTTTNAQGEYYFSNKAGGNATFMGSGESCSLSVNNTQTSLNTYTLTTQNADSKTDNNYQTDIRDSDATVSGGNAVINFTAGNSGQNNHGLDFGYKPSGSSSFSCSTDDSLFQIIVDGTGDKTFLRKITPSSNTASILTIAETLGDKNGSYGYNPIDGHIYGLSFEANKHMFKIGADGVFIDLGQVSGLPIGDYNTGEVLPNGKMLFKDKENDKPIYVIDLTSNPLQIAQTLTPASGTPRTADWAYNKADGMLYTIDHNSDKLMRINTVTGESTSFGAATFIGNYGAQWFDKQGNFYVYKNDSGDLFRVNLTTGVQTKIITSDNTAKHDGISCHELVSSISGTVYADSNNNDAFDTATESGIASITVTLLNAANNSSVATTSTAADGSYSFASVNPALTYKIQVDETDTELPAGSTIGTTNPLTNKTVTAGSTLANQNFGFDLAGNRSISGKVFEDKNYGGGVGRPLSTPGIAGILGVRVELYDSTGAFVTSTTTADGGPYSFTNVAAGNYYVRVVNDTVRSTRAGSTAAERAIQTHRSDGTTDVNNEVGGRKPALVDATANTTNQTLNPATFVLSGGGQAQSVQPITIASTDITGANFGFNFNTVVNTNDSGQGSLRQFILNANLLGNDSTLAQTGRTAGKDNAILELSTSDLNYNAANQYWSIAVQSALPALGNDIILDASTQPARTTAPTFTFANRPVIELNGSNAGDYTNGLALNGATNGSTVKYFAINRFKMAGIQVVQSKNNLIASNYIGTDPTGAINRGNGDSGITVISPLGPNLIGGSSSAGNLIAYNGGDGIKVGGTDGTKATSMLGNKIYANGKLGIDLGGNGITVNDANDADTGTNDLINFPILATITESGGSLTLKGCAPAGATIELFEADVSAGGKATPGDNKFGKSKDYGEGQTYLASFEEGSASDTDTATCAIATDTDGNNHTGMNAFTVTIPTPAGFVTGDSMTATATLSNSGTSEFSPTVLLLEAYNVAGKIYEDVNYGGGNGRAFNAATAGMTGISGASVELRDASNNVFATTTSTADGSYTFTNIPVGVYSVQVVNASVRSTRSGSNGSERGVITYRTDGVNNVSTASTAFSQAITLSNANLSNVSFGFNFDTITNTNDSGAGSLRQFILNANVLGDDSSLAQVGRTAGKENAILELSTTDDPNYNTGYWSIPLQSALPPITAPIVLDGALPQGSNSNPTLELNGTNAGGAANGLALSAGASSSTLRKLAINGFSGAGIYLNGSDNNYLLANYIGITPAGIPRGNTGSGIRLDTASANKIGSTINGDGNIIANNTGNGITIAGSKADTLLNSILGNSIYANGGLGIDLVGGTEIGSVTTNDTKDIDEGPNHLLNYPEVKVNSFGVNGTKIVTYDFNLDVPAGDYRLEFFVSADKDDSGHGEGQTFIGSKDISHPGTESLNFKGTFNANMTVAKGTFISATLTQKSNATTFGSTSEFSGIQDGITTQVCDSLITGTAGNIVIDETNTATIIQLLEAKDSNGNPITYVISGGADGNFFTIVNPTPGATLDCATVKFLTSNVIITKSARDNNEAEARATLPGTLPPAGNYELPLDKDQDNVYELQITATTADGKKYVRDLNVRVMDINEAPSITSASLVLTNEDSNADVMMVQAQDPDVGDKLTYRISSGADSSHFEINATTGILRFRAIPDYDAPMDANRDNTYEIEITVTDKGGLSSKKLFQIRIVNNTADDGVVINVRALLQGPYDNKTALMSANLNTLGLLPNKHPYQAFGHAGAETLSTMLKETTGNNAVVDWALVELRTSPGSVVASRAVILQRDGDLVDAQTGSPNLHFANIKAGNYYVSVRHRNHLGVVSASPVSLDNSAKMLDFAASSTVVRGEESRFVSGKLAWMWAGDINGSHTLTANGPGNDVTSLLSGVITSMDNLQGNTNHILSGYLATDLNFDGKTLFTGPGNDTSLLVGNILLHPLNTGFAANYIVKGGLQ